MSMMMKASLRRNRVSRNKMATKMTRTKMTRLLFSQSLMNLLVNKRSSPKLKRSTKNCACPTMQLGCPLAAKQRKSEIPTILSKQSMVRKLMLTNTPSGTEPSRPPKTTHLTPPKACRRNGAAPALLHTRKRMTKLRLRRNALLESTRTSRT